MQDQRTNETRPAASALRTQGPSSAENSTENRPNGQVRERNDDPLSALGQQLESITKALAALRNFDFSPPIPLRGTRDPVDNLALTARMLQGELRATAVPASHVQSLLASMPHPVALLDLNGNITQQNRAIERLLRTSGASDFLSWFNSCLPPGSNFLDLESWLDPVKISCKISEVTLHYLFLCSPLRSQADQIVGYVVVGNDLTEQEWTKQELERAKALAQSHADARFSFVTNMSHEIRTPLHGILGSAELLLAALSGQDGEEADRHARTIQACGKHLLALVSDIMDFSRIDGQRINIEQREFELPTLLRDCMAGVEHSYGKEGVSTRVIIAENFPQYVRGDSMRIRQVISNLLSNALKFTHKGSVELLALVQSREGDTVNIRIEVRDTGIGITPEKQAKLFDPFEQGDASSTREFGGTGLGLAIVRGIVDLMKGEVGVSSKLNEGSTFWFTAAMEVAPTPQPQPVPAVGVKKKVGVAAPSAPAAPKASYDAELLKDSKILLVEDNLVSRRIAARMLQKVGCDVSVAGHGAEALEKAKQTDFDVILMDCQMPVMDGITATKELRLYEGDRRHTPVIALTADAFEDNKRRCMEAGMDDYLRKPIGKENLCHSISKHLKLIGEGFYQRG